MRLTYLNITVSPKLNTHNERKKQKVNPSLRLKFCYQKSYIQV